MSKSSSIVISLSDSLLQCWLLEELLLSSIAFNTGKDVASVSENMHSIAAIGVPIQRIASLLKLIAIMSSVIYYCFPKFPTRDSGCFKADIKVSDAVVKERLSIYTPFSS